MKKNNRRKNRRITVNLLAGETVGGQYHLPLLANLSETGLYLESPSGLERPPAHDRVVELALPGAEDLVWARCKVVRHDQSGFFQGHALEFVDISAHDRLQIRSYLHRCVGIA